MQLDGLFSPRAVAVIGASNRELTIGYRIIQNLLDFGYTGPVYPVNPKGGETRESKTCPSVLDAAEDVSGGATDVIARAESACLTWLSALFHGFKRQPCTVR